MLEAPSVFEEFNARGVAHRVLASKFVAPETFTDLVKPTHTVLVGPRGSGKTTLLRMLETPSLQAWHGEEAEGFRSGLDYSGVFIPTDRNWDRQLSTLGGDVLNELERALVQDAIFSAHVLWSLVSAMESRLAEVPQGQIAHRHVELSRREEAGLAEELALAWDLELRIPSLASLRIALRRRMLLLQQTATKEMLLDNRGRSERLATTAGIGMNYQDAAAIAVEYFNELAGETAARWALMFDELEFAPPRIREQLIRSLRSTDPKFLFKLSLAPYTAGTPLLGDLLGAMSEHDFVTIPLFYGRKEEGYNFARRLSDALLQRQHSSLDAEQFLGHVSLGADPQAGTRVRANPRTVSRRLKRLQARDPTFARYLSDRAWTPDELATTTASQRAAELRKILPLVAVRSEYLRDAQEPGIPRRRGITAPTIYGGDVALFAMLESNPRNITGVLTKLMAVGVEKPAPPHRQMAEARKVRNRFRALLATVPTARVSGARGGRRGLLGVVDAIGEYFQDEVLLKAFSTDPAETFNLDSKVPDAIVDSLGIALNAGAIVYVPQEGQESVPHRLRNNRYRLSYLFAPRYGLPIRLGRSVSLSSILYPSSAAPAPDNPAQERLSMDE